MNLRERWTRYPQEVLIAVDQLANAILPPIFTLSYSDETLSARTYRGARRGRIMGRIALPIIDFLFAWQSPDPDIVDEAGVPIRGHCERAYCKERLRRSLPPEYREDINSLEDRK